MDCRSKTFATPKGRLRIRRLRWRIPKRNKLHYRYRPARRAHGEREERAAGRGERRRAAYGATQGQKPRHQTREGNGQATDPQPRKGNRATRVAANIAFFSIFRNLHISVKFCKKFCKILQKFCGFLKILQNLPKNVKNFANFSNFLAEISRICSREGDFLVDFEKC